MTYEVRNSIVLLIFLILIGAGGAVLLNMKFGQNFTKFEQELKAKNDQLKKLQETFAQIDGYAKQLKQNTDRLKYYPKVILPEQTIHQTYRYLEEIDRYGTFFNFRFNLVEVQRKDNVSKASYDLSGEGDFPKFIQFIRRLEYGSPLYKIESLRLKKKISKSPAEKTTDGDLEIALRLNGVFFAQTEKPDLMALGPYADTNSELYSYLDPFQPLILDYLPPNTENLINVENSRLVALTANSAFIQDQQGAVREIKVGGAVYLGFLSKIDLNKGEALFLMDRGGISDMYVLQLKSSGKGSK
jgi:hypothetical protein